MQIKRFLVCASALLPILPILPLQAQSADASADRLARMEARLLEMEARLAAAERDSKKAKVMASNSSGASNSAMMNVMADNAWRKLRWTDQKQWAAIVPGVSKEKVIEALGTPPRSVKSLKPRIDEVYFYETSLLDKNNAMRGKISFRKDKVVSVQKPNFQVAR